jgi:hypothetical protein
MKVRALHILLCLSLALNVAAVVASLILHRWDCDCGVLQEEVTRGLVVQWTYPDGITEDRFPSLWEMVRGARPTYVHVDYPAFETDLLRIDTFAAALQRFGRVEELTIGQGAAPAVERLLRGLGSQPHMTDFYCFSGDMSDLASESLSHFPRVRNLAIVGSSFTGARFPLMERLCSFDCSFNPTSLLGLRRIAACPSLKELILREPEEGSLEYRQVVETLRTEFPNVKITGVE